jgi:hypothetical protein
VRLLRYWLLRAFIFVTPALALVSCGGKQLVPLPAAPADPVVAKVIVPVPCEIAQVPPTEDPAGRARKGDDVFTLSKIALASRRVLKGEIGELRAANTTPCPGVP